MTGRQRIAVLGGGGVGSCAALEIARHGYSVDIFEQETQPVTRASRVNEGKIHVGFLYANDPSQRTAELMARGALTFADCLHRWLDLRPDDLVLSTPFLYAVHRDSLLTPDQLSRHYGRVCSDFATLRASMGSSYLGLDEEPSFRELRPTEVETALDPEHFSAVFETSERSVDPRVVAARLSDVVLNSRGVEFHGDCRVVGLERDARDRFWVQLGDGSAVGPYDQVVNALWAGRLTIDRLMGLEPQRRWIHRHKFGSRVRLPLTPEQLPSVTMVLGPFGDIVNFGTNGMYLSWYPIGMVATSQELEPPPAWADVSDEFRTDIFQRSLAAWRRYCPALNELDIADTDVDAASGPIFAWGNTGIDDPQSELHERFSIGVTSTNGYHSVNTGKYTTMPYLALVTAQRVLGFETVAR